MDGKSFLWLNFLGGGQFGGLISKVKNFFYNLYIFKGKNQMYQFPLKTAFGGSAPPLRSGAVGSSVDLSGHGIWE